MTENKVVNELDDKTQDVEKASEPEKVTDSETSKGNRAGNTEKAAASRAKAADKVGKSATSRKGKKLREYTIVLNDSANFPPGGLVLGKNGKFKKLQAEKPVKLDENWLQVLNNAVQTEPRRDDNGRIIGTRNVPRFPYRIVPDAEE